jgi:hypothetical protein
LPKPKCSSARSPACDPTSRSMLQTPIMTCLLAHRGSSIRTCGPMENSAGFARLNRICQPTPRSGARRPHQTQNLVRE